MPQVIVHASKKMTAERKTRMIREMREAIPKLLDIPDHIGQVIVYETAPENRSVHAGRDRHFIFFEATMYPGRTGAVKANFMHHFMELLSKFAEVNMGDINGVIHEIPPENYFGGATHKYIEDL